MKLTSLQQKAIRDDKQSLIVLAGAGSGKTEILIRRLEALIRSGVGLNQILAVTFTEKAAADLKSRLAQCFGAAASAQGLLWEIPFAAIGTFHSLCAKLIKEFGPAMGISSSSQVIEENTSRLLIQRMVKEVLLSKLHEAWEPALTLVEELEFRPTTRLLEELLQFRWHAKLALTSPPHEMGDKERKLHEATFSLFEICVDAYQNAKAARSALDFQDLELEVLKLLEERKDILQALRRRWRYLFVDEYQDTNDLQTRLIELLFDPQVNTLFLVGDAKQSIYRFRGANVRGFLNLVEKFRKEKIPVMNLSENFRSRPAIIEFINRVFPSLLENYQPLRAQRSSTPDEPVRLMGVSGPVSSEKPPSLGVRRRQEAGFITQIALDLRDKGMHSFRDMAILMPSLSDARIYEQALREVSIPYRIFGGRGLLSRQEILDLICCLKWVLQSKDRLALVGILRSPLIGLPDTEITKWANNGEDMEDVALGHPQCELLRFLKNVGVNKTASRILEEVVTQTHYDWICHHLDPSGMMNANIEQLIGLARNLEVEEGASLEEFVSFLEELKKRRASLAEGSSVDATEDVVKLMTVHAAKGLEFPVVFLADVFRHSPPNSLPYCFVRGEGLITQGSLTQGLGLRPRSAENPFGEREIPPSFLKLKEKSELEETQEKARLLYVAMTRAKERLFIPWHRDIGRPSRWQSWIQDAIEKNPDLSCYPIPVGRQVPASEVPIAPPEILSKAERTSSKTRMRRIYSVTELEVLVKDPARYRRRFIECIADVGPLHPEESKTWEGVLFHEVLKRYDPRETIDVRKLLSQTAWQRGGNPSSSQLEGWLALLEGFLASPDAPSFASPWRELPFQLNWNHSIITGVVDYVEEREGKAILVDFKMDTIRDPTDYDRKRQDYQLQMDLYALAFSRVWGKRLQETQLLFIDPPHVVREAVTQSRLKRAEDRLRDALEAKDFM